MVSTWVPGPPGLSYVYIHKDARLWAWVSSGSAWLIERKRGSLDGTWVRHASLSLFGPAQGKFMILRVRSS